MKLLPEPLTSHRLLAWEHKLRLQYIFSWHRAFQSKFIPEAGIQVKYTENFLMSQLLPPKGSVF